MALAADAVMLWMQENYTNAIVDTIRAERQIEGRTVDQTIYIIPRRLPDSRANVESSLVNGRVHFFRDVGEANLTVWIRSNTESPWRRDININWCVADPEWLQQLEQHLDHYFGA